MVYYLSFGTLGHVSSVTSTVTTSPTHGVVVSRRLCPRRFYGVAVSCPGVSSASRLVFQLVYHVNCFDSVSGRKTRYVCANVVASANKFACGSGGQRVCFVVDRLLSGKVSGSSVCHGMCGACSRDHLHLVKCILSGVAICSSCGTTLVALAGTRRDGFGCVGNSDRKFIGVPLAVGGIYFSYFLHRSARGPVVGVSLHSMKDFPYGRLTTRFFRKNKRLGTSNNRFFKAVRRTGTIFRGTLRGCGPLLATGD